MTFSVTALALVNRVHRRRRMPDVSSFSETEDLATLDSLNHAIEEVLSSRRWEFDMRRDQITLRPRLTGLGAGNLTPNSASVILTSTASMEDADVFGDYGVRLVVSDATEYANTAFRVHSAQPISPGGLLTTLFLRTTHPEDMSAATFDCELHYPEYMLPETVRDVVRVTHHEEDVTLSQIDAVVEFEEVYPKPHSQFGAPEVVSVGGLDLPTFDSTGSDPAPSLRLIVWPIPDEAYVLDYTYHYRHPELTATTSTLDGVPPNILDQIVDMAAADMKAFYEKDYDALKLRAFTQAKVDAMHSQHGGMYADRKPVGNWDGSAGRYRGDHRWSRGRLIGGG